MDRRIVYTPMAPEAIGPYSQAVISNGFVFTSGQIPLDPGTGSLIEGNFHRQVDQVLHNINALLSAAGSDLSKAVKITVYVLDLSHFSIVNDVFETCFSGMEPPARSTIEVSALPLGAEIEIDCVATC